MPPRSQPSYPRLWPGCPVLVAKENYVSGATIGNQGVVLRLHRQSVWDNPREPRRWRYTVYVPSQRRLCQRQARDLLSLVLIEPEYWGSQPPYACELKFDRPLAGDLSLVGRFHLPGRHTWDHFEFRKCEQKLAAYSLCCRPDAPSAPWKLDYRAPRSALLSCDYVIRAMNRMFRRPDRVADFRPHC